MGATYKTKANRLFAQVTKINFATEGNKPCLFRAYAVSTVVGGTWAYVSEEVGPVEVNKTLTGYTGAQQIGSWGLGKSDGRTIDLELSKFRVYAGALIVIEAIPDGASETIVSVGWKQFL